MDDQWTQDNSTSSHSSQALFKLLEFELIVCIKCLFVQHCRLLPNFSWPITKPIILATYFDPCSRMLSFDDRQEYLRYDNPHNPLIRMIWDTIILPRVMAVTLIIRKDTCQAIIPRHTRQTTTNKLTLQRLTKHRSKFNILYSWLPYPARVPDHQY